LQLALEDLQFFRHWTVGANELLGQLLRSRALPSFFQTSARGVKVFSTVASTSARIASMPAVASGR
jgi:hypothetical protein